MIERAEGTEGTTERNDILMLFQGIIYFFTHWILYKWHPRANLRGATAPWLTTGGRKPAWPALLIREGPEAAASMAVGCPGVVISKIKKKTRLN